MWTTVQIRKGGSQQQRKTRMGVKNVLYRGEKNNILRIRSAVSQRCKECRVGCVMNTSKHFQEGLDENSSSFLQKREENNKN